MALRDQKPRAFCTFWDVVSLAQQISTEKIDISEAEPFLFSVVKYKAQIEDFIHQVDATIFAKLRVYYTLAELMGTVANSKATVPTPGRHNQGDTELISVKLNTAGTPADIYTAAWTLRFTTNLLYNVYSSLEGAQGTGWSTADATQTSTNTELTIESGFWIPNKADFVTGDTLYLSVHRVHPFIQHCSCLLATAMAMTSLYVAESPNMSDFGSSLWKRGMGMIHQLALAADGQATSGTGEEMMVGASLDDTVPEWDLSTQYLDYEVTDLGSDLSPTLTNNAGVPLYGEGDPSVG